MVLSLWKYLEGYVVIKVTGYSPERFMNLCANKNIYIWNVHRVSDGYIFSISKKAFFMLRPIARKTKCRVKIQRKVGIPFKTRKFRKRRFFLLGFLLCMLTIFMLSLFVWRIEVEGNVDYTTQEILETLKQQDIKVGTFKLKINCKDLDNFLLTKFDQTMWVSSELIGTKLVIHVREGIKVDLKEPDTKPCDLIATKSGTVISIVMRKGTPMVKAGDTVEPGDTLVSGTLEIKELTQLKAVDFTHADADIYIKTTYEYYDSLDLKYIYKDYFAEPQTDKSLNIFGFKINVFKPRIESAKCDRIYRSKQVKILDDFYLPIYKETVEYLPYQEIEKEYSIDEAKQILQKNFSTYIKNLEENNIQILSNDVIFKEDGDVLIAQGNIQVAEKDGIVKYFDEHQRRSTYNEYFTQDDGNTP